MLPVVEILVYVIQAVYVGSLGFILLYSLSEAWLTLLYLGRRSAIQVPVPTSEFPEVTVQLPVFNERYVILRLIKAVTEFDYPKDKLHIQVLDDSTDDTTELIRQDLGQYQAKGIDIVHLRRNHRNDFKAGALREGLKSARGTFLAIFDADFIPPPHYLKATLPYFSSIEVGVVQARWGHLNERYSLLTRLQAYALNAHFTIEQGGRAAGGHFINFNGTAGIWRRETIESAGGWEGDTLTEDLDLSYRAQLKGWKFIYLEDLVCPAELPAEMNGLRSQQFRWAKGAAEVARKVLGKVLFQGDVPLSTRFAGIFHLLNSLNWVALTLTGVLLLPFLLSLGMVPNSIGNQGFMMAFHATFFILLFYYFVANRHAGVRSWRDTLIFLISYPVFLSISMGIALNNAIGVIEGYLGIRSSFVRTPKFSIRSSTDSYRGKSYVGFQVKPVTILEWLLLPYSGFTLYVVIAEGMWSSFSFALLWFVGGLAVQIIAVVQYLRARR